LDQFQGSPACKEQGRTVCWAGDCLHADLCMMFINLWYVGVCTGTTPAVCLPASLGIGCSPCCHQGSSTGSELCSGSRGYWGVCRELELRELELNRQQQACRLLTAVPQPFLKQQLLWRRETVGQGTVTYSARQDCQAPMSLPLTSFTAEAWQPRASFLSATFSASRHNQHTQSKR
jgi:hypothetical protein